MDDLEFRRRLFSDPNDPELLNEAKHDHDKHKLVDELKEFDAYLKSSTEVDIPQGLEAKLLSIPAEDLDSEDNRVDLAKTDNVISLTPWYKKVKAPLATAASTLLAVSLYFATSINAPLQAGEHALQHVYYEESALERTRTVALRTVNEKLAMFGAKFENLPGEVIYATFCNFKGQRSLHLIFQSEHGPVTLFVVPSDEDQAIIKNGNFEDERYEGIIDTNNKANTILVAELGTPLGQYTEEVSNALRWL